jgi:hypothetical protein
MYFGLIITIILLVMISLAVSQYKEKAISSGEADISLTGKNILPFCRTCKYSSFTSFVIMVITGFILILSTTQSGDAWWTLSDVEIKNLTTFHFIVGIIFVLSFAFHTYIHWNWIKALFGNKPRPIGKQL